MINWVSSYKKNVIRQVVEVELHGLVKSCLSHEYQERVLVVEVRLHQARAESNDALAWRAPSRLYIACGVILSTPTTPHLTHFP